jgi:hypothetical protein
MVQRGENEIKPDMPVCISGDAYPKRYQRYAYLHVGST